MEVGGESSEEEGKGQDPGSEAKSAGEMLWLTNQLNALGRTGVDIYIWKHMFIYLHYIDKLRTLVSSFSILIYIYV